MAKEVEVAYLNDQWFVHCEGTPQPASCWSGFSCKGTREGDLKAKLRAGLDANAIGARQLA